MTSAGGLRAPPSTPTIPSQAAGTVATVYARIPTSGICGYHPFNSNNIQFHSHRLRCLHSNRPQSVDHHVGARFKFWMFIKLGQNVPNHHKHGKLVPVNLERAYPMCIRKPKLSIISLLHGSSNNFLLVTPVFIKIFHLQISSNIFLLNYP